MSNFFVQARPGWGTANRLIRACGQYPIMLQYEKNEQSGKTVIRLFARVHDRLSRISCLSRTFLAKAGIVVANSLSTGRTPWLLKSKKHVCSTVCRRPLLNGVVDTSKEFLFFQTLQEFAHRFLLIFCFHVPEPVAINRIGIRLHPSHNELRRRFRACLQIKPRDKIATAFLHSQ